MKYKVYLFSTILLVVLTVPMFVSAQIASGGSYVLEQTVIANGGGMSSGSGYSVEGTSGQSLARSLSSGGAYTARGGFWTNLFAPTAAGASISGHVTLENGRGLKDVRVVLSGGTLTAQRTVITNLFGYFKFEDVEVGQTYVVSVRHKLYDFGQPSQIFTLMDDLTGLDFQASWAKR